MVYLQVYVTKNCAFCERSRALAAAIATDFPSVHIEIIDIATLAKESWPDALFATPTWLWNGQIYCLGTPDPGLLRQRISAFISSSLTTLHPKGYS
ncbi:MAG: hypothetical protein DSY55_02365 [Clostridia bacterium]|nr:MAG: hypothetical protein DSY55_02365 [Clostridia bacterium]